MLRGTIRIDDLIEKAKEYKYHSVPLTDLNGMYGSVHFAKKALEAGINPIIGTVLDDPSNDSIYAVLLAKNNYGYSRICHLITQRKLNNDFSLVKALSYETKDFFIITPSFELLSKLPTTPNLYAGLIPTKKKSINTRKVYEYAIQRGIKFTALHPAYFLCTEDYKLHKVLTAIRLNTNIHSIPKNALVDEGFIFKPVDELKRVWNKKPEALQTAKYISDNCRVDLSLNKYKLAHFPVPAEESSFSFLWKTVNEGFRERYNSANEEARKRLDKELFVIEELNLIDYFLIVWDIVREAKKRGMMIIGRGSAANSIVAYCLGITNVEPIKYKLYFERFLNRGRSSPPDIDIDFSWKERDEIIRYVFEKYGYDNVAMISTHVTFRARSAFREVAKAFGITDAEISKISKYIPWTNASNLPNISEMFPESKNINLKIEPWKTIINFAAKIANYPRYLSIHPGGIVITPTKVTDYTALEYTKNKGLGLIITQPDMYGIEDLGLIKIDLLSQRSLGVLRDTMRRIKAP
jgi:DNA polymerase III alpha subunit